MNKGIKDKAAVVGMGCSKFGERFDMGVEDLLLEAVQEALDSANMKLDDIDAFWYSTFKTTTSGTGLSTALKTDYKPVTRVENMCCSGLEAFKGACYAVASGAVDVAMAVGIEKLKDGGMSGLTGIDLDIDRTSPYLSAPSVFSFIAPAYSAKYGVSQEDIRKALSHIAFKNHSNGALNPKAQYRKEIPVEIIERSPVIAYPLTVMDCSGVSDGAAAAIIVSPEYAKKFNDKPLYVKGIGMSAGPGNDKTQDFDFTYCEEIKRSAQSAYAEAGITDPRKEISIAEVHDCFTITEMIIYEDLGFSKRGEGWKDSLNGVFDRDGEIPVNIDGGLKSFGHPIGASGIRMIYESWLQNHGLAGERQVKDFKLGLAQNLGGLLYGGVSGVAIVGAELG